jgi:hypothetical protein
MVSQPHLALDYSAYGGIAGLMTSRFAFFPSGITL